MEELYLISCPSCHAQVQIKSLDENLDIRFCPNCATKIQVIRAQTVPVTDTPPSTAAAAARPVRPIHPVRLAHVGWRGRERIWRPGLPRQLPRLHLSVRVRRVHQPASGRPVLADD